MSQPTKEVRRGMFRGGKNRQDGGPFAVTVITPSSAENALVILPQHGESAGIARF
jgi:hypothetical protein